jgi:hypothetical protein
METEFISGVKAATQIAKTKKGSAVKLSPTTVAKKDQITLSTHAKEVMETKRFVEMLRQMPDVRLETLEREYDFSSPEVFKAVARKLIAEGF